MKATLEFELPDDQDAHRLALNGVNYWGALWDLDNWLRAEYKHNDNLNRLESDAYDRVRSRIREFMADRGVSLEDVA